jgi:hypothetical protein
MYKIIYDGMLNKDAGVLRLSDGACVPFALDNTDYQTFKKDLAGGAQLQDAEGNVIDGIAYLKELV